jgi:hypothetical protein
LAIDGPTGDFIFDPTRDILAVSGLALARQTIITRLKIPRASFVYDEDGTLGSRLNEMQRATTPAALKSVPDMVHEALADMPGIALKDVQAYISDDDKNAIVVRIIYSTRLEEEPPAPEIEEDMDIIDFMLTVGGGG